MTPQSTGKLSEVMDETAYNFTPIPANPLPKELEEYIAMLERELHVYACIGTRKIHDNTL